MKLSLKKQAVEKQISKDSIITEYNLNDEMLDFSIAKISGRYPDEKRVMNLKCNELGYVSEGEGKIVINDKEYKLSTGDVVLIEAGEKYFWEGNMKVYITCRPAWKAEQHKAVD